MYALEKYINLMINISVERPLILNYFCNEPIKDVVSIKQPCWHEVSITSDFNSFDKLATQTQFTRRHLDRFETCWMETRTYGRYQCSFARNPPYDYVRFTGLVKRQFIVFFNLA